MDRGAWEATAHGVAESRTCLCVHAHTHTHTQLSVKLRTLLNHQCFVCKIIYCVGITVRIEKKYVEMALTEGLACYA